MTAINVLWLIVGAYFAWGVRDALIHIGNAFVAKANIDRLRLEAETGKKIVTVER